MPQILHLRNIKQNHYCRQPQLKTPFTHLTVHHVIVNINLVQLPDATLFAKSLRCVNRTQPNKEIMITMRDIWTSNLEGLFNSNLFNWDQ